MSFRNFFWVIFLAAVNTPVFPNEPAASLPDKIDYNRDVRPLLSEACFACHGPDNGARKAKLRLDTRDGSTANLEGDRAIVPGNPDKSEMLARISSDDPEQRMPPGKNDKKLSEVQIKTLTRWVAQGAPYAEHWSFIKPRRQPLPEVKQKAWIENGIDAFILARLEKEGLGPSPRADKHTLIRRVSLDLTGLPPTLDQVDAFVNDASADAYDKAVDRLLDSPAFGERWARMWLDLARYADSAGFGSDPLRLNIWPYRDWVIGAFNRNLPYDRFTIEQLAGDLLPDPAPEQLLATAFHRNTMTNTEGGTDPEEFRVAAVKDRIATTAQVWMGLTLQCAQCHSHKFDPISQKEYYQFFAVFNQTEDANRADEAPTMPFPTPHENAKVEALKQQLAALEKELTAPNAQLDADLAAWEKSLPPPPRWTVLEASKLHSENGATLARQADHSILVGAASPADDTYLFEAHAGVKSITAVRLEALSDETLPGNGPGRAAGNFVLSEIGLSVVPEKDERLQGRYVRVENPGKAKFLHLAEVQVFSGGRNVALNGKAVQSSTDYDGPAALAVDGNTNGDYSAKSVSHTKSEDDPWWEVDLGGMELLDRIVVWNRSDGGLHERLKNFNVKVFDDQRRQVWRTAVAEAPKYSVVLALSGERKIALTKASADFSQADFGIETALGNATKKKGGWAVSPQTGRNHEARFETDGPVDAGGETLLRFTLAQNFGAMHTLGKFRLSVTDQKLPGELPPVSISEILSVAPDNRGAAQKKELADYYRGFAPALQKTRDEIMKLQSQLAAVKPPSVPVMREVAENKRRVSHLFNKGNFLTPGEKVEAGIPEAFNALPAGAKADRMGVARWLVAPDNPLAARVAVNRFWGQIFGTGIVETEEDFGTQGALPSHPELLDWLALEFAAPGDGKTAAWDVKALLKKIVLSATYRQSSRLTAELLEKDPRNRLLGRGVRKRLDAEMVRDQALAISGLLSRKIGGPSVYPPQPDGLWRAAFNGQRTWATSSGEDRYRRGIYTFWRRTVPYPSMNTFDAPSREQCTLRRFCTNTPLQAFVTLNDPVYVEAAQALARRIVKEGGNGTEARVRFGLGLSLARVPDASQVQVLAELFDRELKHYQGDAAAAKKMATEPLGPAPLDLNEAELAAWTVVANVLLNLDGVLTKN